jgi:hypothetical protein
VAEVEAEVAAASLAERAQRPRRAGGEASGDAEDFGDSNWDWRFERRRSWRSWRAGKEARRDWRTRGGGLGAKGRETREVFPTAGFIVA